MHRNQLASASAYRRVADWPAWRKEEDRPRALLLLAIAAAAMLGYLALDARLGPFWQSIIPICAWCKDVRTDEGALCLRGIDRPPGALPGRRARGHAAAGDGTGGGRPVAPADFAGAPE